MIGFTSGTLGAGRRSVAVAASTGQPDGERRARCGEVLRAVFPARAVTPTRCPARVPRTPPAPGNGGEAARGAIAGRLWAAAVPADDTPARVYLARGRSVWPPDSIGPGLPASVRWLPRGAVRRDVAADWYDVPEHTAGAIVYAFRQPGGATIRAVGLDALDADGRRPDQTPVPASPGLWPRSSSRQACPRRLGQAPRSWPSWAASSSRGFSFCHSRGQARAVVVVYADHV